MELALPLSVNKQLRSFTDRIHHVAMFPKRVENNKTKFITRPKLANTRIKSPPNKNYQHKSSVFTWETQDILPKRLRQSEQPRVESRRPLELRKPHRATAYLELPSARYLCIDSAAV